MKDLTIVKKADLVGLTDGNDLTFIQMQATPEGVIISSHFGSEATFRPKTARAIARDLIKLADRVEKAEKKAGN